MSSLVSPNRNITIASGKAYVGRYAPDGTLIGEDYLGLAHNIKASVASEKAEVPDYTSPARSVAASLVTKTTFKLSFSVYEKTLKNMRRFFLGGSRQISQAASSGASKSIDLPELDTWIMIDGFYLRDIENVSIESGGSSLNPEDYLVDNESARVYIKTSSGLHPGDTIVVHYDVPAKTYNVIEPLTSADEAFLFRFKPHKKVQGPRYEVIVPRCTITPQGEYGMVDESIDALQMEFNALEFDPEAPDELSKFAKIIELERAS